MGVSTHSRLKAAAADNAPTDLLNKCFNTQPPEGGCHWLTDTKGRILVSTHSRLKAADRRTVRDFQFLCFNTQPPEGGCSDSLDTLNKNLVSTHSRLKAAVE